MPERVVLHKRQRGALHVQISAVTVFRPPGSLPSLEDQMTPQGNTTSAPGPSPEPHAALWEDFVDIFYAPSSVFRRRAAGSYMIPLIVVTLLVAVLSVTNHSVMQPVLDAELDKAMAPLKSNPQMTADALAKARSIGEISTQVLTMIGAPIAILFFALVAWIFSRIFDAKVNGHAAMVIAAYSAIPFVIENVWWGIQGLLMDPSKLTSRLSLSMGAGRFVTPGTMSPVVAAALNHIDVFSIWSSALLGIGIVAIANAPRSRAWLVGGSIWALGFLPGVLGALRQG
jgi:hypothetical protein